MTEMSHLVTKPKQWLCIQRRLRSAWASAQSDPLGICPVWSESSLCAQWVAKDPRLHADSEDSDQTGRMPRLIWVFAGCTTTLLVLSRDGSNVLEQLYNPTQTKPKQAPTFLGTGTGGGDSLSREFLLGTLGSEKKNLHLKLSRIIVNEPPNDNTLRLIWEFAGHRVILLVLSWASSNVMNTWFFHFMYRRKS